MKSIIPLICIFLLTPSCMLKKDLPPAQQAPQMEIGHMEYGMETFDPKFKTWYRQQKEAQDNRSESFYEAWNKKYVMAWNEKARSAKNSFFEPIVGYSDSIDYDFELDHQLFYYFRYVEKELRVPILPDGPDSISE